jgi:transposase-like protein
MEKKAEKRDEFWRQRVTEHESSGVSVKRFCEQNQISEQSFYSWRKRLRNQTPMRFALVETGAGRPTVPAESGLLEFVLVTGERLRIGAGFDASLLRQVLAALRA